MLEALEDRWLPAPMTFVVTNTNDSNAGSLRQAIMDANGNPGLDTIEFKIAPASVQTIAPSLALGALPAITSPLFLDGNAPAGFAGQIIVLNGANIFFGGNGLTFVAGSSGSTVRRLVIQGFAGGAGIAFSGTSGNFVLGNKIGTDVTGMTAVPNGTGVSINGGATGNTIGGTAAGSGNLISGNSSNGVYIGGTGTTGNVVLGNRIGTNVNGSAGLGNGNQMDANSSGVNIDSGATGNTIGGTAVGSANLISGNADLGITLSGSNNFVLGNAIGTDVTGTAKLSNNAGGIYIGGNGNTVGGTVLGAANIISGNGASFIAGIAQFGVYLAGNNNIILGNKIGTDVSGTANLANFRNGVVLQNGATGNTIGGTAAGAGNIIAFHPGQGVGLSGANTVRNSILGNSIFANKRLGIDLGSPPANHGQKAPRLTAVNSTATSTTVKGVLTSSPGTYRLEFFASPPQPGFQGKRFLGFVNVTVPAAGVKNFTAVGLAAMPAGRVVTATATNLTSGPAQGDTSQFSRPAAALVVTFNPAVVPFVGSRNVLLTAMVSSGPTPIPSGMVTFTIVPASGGAAIGVFQAPVVNGKASTLAHISIRTRPGFYKIVAVYKDSSGFFQGVTATSATLLAYGINPPARFWSFFV